MLELMAMAGITLLGAQFGANAIQKAAADETLELHSEVSDGEEATSSLDLIGQEEGTSQEVGHPTCEPAVLSSTEPAPRGEGTVSSNCSDWAKSPLPEPCPWAPESQTFAGFISEGEQEQDPEFELWVEADIQAEWCLPDVREEANGDKWQDHCNTSTVKRTWQDFEAMDQMAKPSYEHCRRQAPAPDEKAVKEGLELLGLSEDASPSTIDAAFRRHARTCHPDSCSQGSTEAFDRLVTARRCAVQAATARQGRSIAQH